MKIINNQNLDEWLFDYFEGNLGAEEKKELIGFLHKNPLLKADYDAWKMSYICEQEIGYPNMASLLRTEGGGIKWIKTGLVIVFFVSLFLLYLFYPANNNKQQMFPDKKQSGTVTNEVDCTIVRLKTEQGINEKPLSNSRKKTELPFNPVVEQNNNTIIMPEDMYPIIPGSIALHDSVTKDSLLHILVPIEKTKTPVDSDAVKKKEKSKKELKIIKLKNTGL